MYVEKTVDFGSFFMWICDQQAGEWAGMRMNGRAGARADRQRTASGLRSNVRLSINNEQKTGVGY